MEWWNEQVTGWLDVTLWAPHHVVSLVCVLTAFLALWHATESDEPRRRAASILIAGAALASAAGLSIYVPMVFGLFLAAWLVYLLKRKEYSKILVFVAAGTLALALAGAFLRELAGAPGAFPVALTVRAFQPLRWIPGVMPRRVLRVLLLPLNYFLEL